jgi:hypothetical protein
MREKVAGDADEIRLPLGRPVDAALDSAPAARRNAEMEIRQMDDPHAVELGRQPGHLELECAQSHPPGLEPAPGKTRRCCGAQQGSGAAGRKTNRAGIRPSMT